MTSEIESKKEWDKKVIRAYSNVLKFIPKIASGLISLGFLGYVLGWIRARSYFSEFGAKWILSDLTLMYLLNLSVWPILAILLSLVITMTDIAERLIGKNLRHLILFLIVGFLLMHFGGMILNHYERYETAIFIAYSKLYYSAGILMMVFGEKILQLRETAYQWDSQKIWELSIWFVLFLLSCSSIGTAEGNLDARPKISELPTVVLNQSEENKNWRLLHTNNENFYITIPNSKDSKIKLIKAEAVSYVQ